MDFRDRHVVVTGGTGALGRAVVGALLAAGAHCHVPYRQEREKEGLPGGALSVIPVPSLADEAAVTKLYGGLPSLWASIHIAGGFAFAPLTDTSGELLRRLIDDNLVSCFLCCREAVAAMRRGKGDGSPGGRIVNVAALQALEPRNGAKISASTAAKAGVAALSAALGEELAGEGILVNAVAPSIMDTPTNRRDMPKANFDAWPKVEEVAATILFLASPENKVSRGGVVPVFGASSQSAAS
jgi:NAD(P)-dependent dehydrogenase (short-subunit alcohol dehydrogenase family)